jgi:translation initiation factor IF-3
MKKKAKEAKKNQKKRKREEIKFFANFAKWSEQVFLKLGSSTCKKDAKIGYTCSASFRY